MLPDFTPTWPLLYKWPANAGMKSMPQAGQTTGLQSLTSFTEGRAL
jgi:hypothetical protein